LKAFQKGADGVLVAGCHIGDCHYIKGNYMTIKRMALLKELLRFTGFQEERLYLDWISSAEGVRFAEVIRNFTQKIKDLGPSHLRTKY
jgi:F420-non-reducing hydrogenase iron-sulfur subunit